MTINIIAISGKIGSGKTTLAKQIEKELGFVKRSFSPLLKC